MINIYVYFLLLISSSLSAQNLIEDLQVFDASNAAHWSVQTNLQQGDLMFGDRTFTFVTVPLKYRGLQWVQTANDSKAYSGETLVSFSINDSAYVYLVYDDRLTVRDWMEGWADTGDNILNSEVEAKTFSIYSKLFSAEETVSLGSVDQSTSTNNYVIFVENANQNLQIPDNFEFSAKFDLSPLSFAESDPAIISGLTDATQISAAAVEYAINDDAYTSSTGLINNGDQLKLRLHMQNAYATVSTGSVTIGGLTVPFSARTQDDPQTGWNQAQTILDSIERPVFPDKHFLISDFGAVGDSATDCTEAFRLAISACSDSGGGRVIVSGGTFLTGAIHLKSNVNLYISKNAKIKFSQDPADFLPVVYTRFEGTECYNYSPPIYAFEQENIAITGSGTIDGGGDNSHWWPWKSSGSADVSALRQMAEDGVPVEQRIFGDGHYIRPNMIQPYRCNKVLIDSVTILNGPMWHIHPVLSNHVSVTNVRIIGHGPNNDGCNPESSSNVHIKNCYFDTGDDCIAIKSGRNADGRRINIATENVIIQDCTMKDGHGGVVIGSEISGGARNIFAEDCYMDSPNLDRALRIKTNSIRGGIVENVYLRNISVGEVGDAVVRVNFYYGEGDISNFDPVVRNVEVRNLTCEKSNYALRLEGYARSPITDLRLIDCTMNNIQQQNALNGIRNLVLNNTTINYETFKTIIQPYSDLPVGINSADALPQYKSLVLYPNYPNPFNNNTTIRFYIVEKTYVKLEVYNILGQKVLNALNKTLPGGVHDINLDTSQLSSGIYIYKIATPRNAQSRRFLLLK